MITNILWAKGNNIIFTLPIFLLTTMLLSKQLLWVKKIIYLLAGNKNSKNLFIGFSLNKRIIKLFLISTAVLMLCGALLRPQWAQEKQIIVQQARDLVIAIDVSKSMLAQDFKPNRLEFAKNKIRELISKLDSERIGLIVFSGNAFCQCPLTSDISAIFTFLDSIDTESISSGATSLHAPILKTIELFNNIDKDRKNKLLVIFTDGEDFSDNLSDIKNQAKNIGLKIFTLGIGSITGAPIPILDSNGEIKDYQRDRNNNQIVISKLGESTLNNLSNETGAQYIKATDNSADINTLIKEVRHFDKESIEDKQINSNQEKFYYFALCGLILLGAEWLI